MFIRNNLSPLLRSHRPLRTVLIGTSLGDESDQVVSAGLAVARAAGARVFLEHVVQLDSLPAGLDAGVGPDLGPEQIARCHEEMDRQVDRLGIEETELAGLEVWVGAPHRVLTEAAQKLGADLIVVGATGSGPFAAELLGSTADRVLRKAFCPVLVVRGELQMPPREMLAPVDLSPLSGNGRSATPPRS
jgi:nucleotide-binding universal stress UspA family protein